MIGFKSAKKLGLFDLDVFRTNVDAVVGKNRVEEFFKDFREVFNDQIGKLKNYQVELKID